MTIHTLRHPRERRLAGDRGWTVVIRRAPLGLGWLVRLERGLLYRGAPFVGWWWRPEEIDALNKGYQEAHQ